MQQVAVTRFTDDQLAIIRNTVAKGTSPDQFRLFIEVCHYHNLSPFARQIYAVVRGGQMTIQTSIDGYRLLAERSGKYAGQIGPEWCGSDGEWTSVWLKDEPPAAARVGVLRKDFAQPTWGVAKYKSYFQQNSPLWGKMADVMLAKCAESLALRKAFPAEMSGIYTSEEMQQADSDSLPTVAPLHPTTVEADAGASEQQLSSIRKLCGFLGRPEPEGIASLSVEAARKLIQELTGEYRKMQAERRSTSQDQAATPQAEQVNPDPETDEPQSDLASIPVQSQVEALAKQIYPSRSFERVAKYYLQDQYEEGQEELTPDQCMALYNALRSVQSKKSKAS